MLMRYVLNLVIFSIVARCVSNITFPTPYSREEARLSAKSFLYAVSHRDYELSVNALNQWIRV